MRAFNESQNSSTSNHYRREKPSCSYCGDADHQVTSCPHVKADWAMFQSFNIPCSDPDHWTNNPKPLAVGQKWKGQANMARWFKDPSGWSKWYAECEKAIGKIKAKEVRDAQRANAKAQGKKAKSCGFCGGAGHNRRDCPQMRELNKRLIRANNHWRKRLYDTFVEELGLGEGALVKVGLPSGWRTPETEAVGIITSINWGELNMFCFTDSANRQWNNRVHHNLQSPLEIKVQVNGEEKHLKWSPTTSGRTGVVNDQHGRPLIDNFSNSWSGATFQSVLSPTETPLSEEWLTEGQAECVEFITKKYSYAKLKDWKGIKVLEDYEKRYNLK